MHGKINAKIRTLFVLVLCALSMFTVAFVSMINRPTSALADGESLSDGCFEKVSLTLNDDIVMKYTFSVPDGATDVKAVFTFNGKETVVSDYEEEGANRVYSFYGVLPQFLGRDVTATLKGVVGGEEQVLGSLSNYSVKDYCDGLLAKDKAELGYTDLQYENMQTLIADLLNYGAEAQKHADVDTDKLVNAGLEISGSEYVAPESDLALTGDASDKADWYSASLRLENKIAVVLKFKATDITGLSVSVAKDGVDTYAFAESDFVLEKDNGDGTYIYRVVVDGLSATEFNKLLTAKFMDNGVEIGRTLTYSIKSYVNSKGETNELVKAIYNYGKSAYGFVNFDSLSYSVTTAPTLDQNGVITANAGDFVYNVEIPALSNESYDYVEDGSYAYDRANNSVTNGNVEFTLKNGKYGTIKTTAIVDGKVIIDENAYSVYDVAFGKNPMLALSDGVMTLTLNGSTLGNIVTENVDFKVVATGENALSTVQLYGEKTVNFNGNGSIAINGGGETAIYSNVGNVNFKDGIKIDASSTNVVVRAENNKNFNIIDSTFTVDALGGNVAMFVAELFVGSESTNPTFTVKANGNSGLDETGLGTSHYNFISGTTTVNQKASGYVGININDGQADEIVVSENATLNVTGQFGIAVGNWNSRNAVVKNNGTFDVEGIIEKAFYNVNIVNGGHISAGGSGVGFDLADNFYFNIEDGASWAVPAQGGVGSIHTFNINGTFSDDYISGFNPQVVNINGTFTANSSLVAKVISVYGTVRINSNMTADEINVFGSVEINSNGTAIATPKLTIGNTEKAGEVVVNATPGEAIVPGQEYFWNSEWDQGWKDKVIDYNFVNGSMTITRVADSADNNGIRADMGGTINIQKDFSLTINKYAYGISSWGSGRITVINNGFAECVSCSVGSYNGNIDISGNSFGWR